MVVQPSGFDQLAADDIASAMGRVQKQISWCLEIIRLQDTNDFASHAFYDATVRELDLLTGYWVKLRAARNSLLGDNAVAF